MFYENRTLRGTKLHVLDMGKIRRKQNLRSSNVNENINGLNYHRFNLPKAQTQKGCKVENNFIDCNE